MEIRFNPADKADLATVALIMAAIAGEPFAQLAPTPDARDPASVFVPLQPVAPLPAAAMPSPIVPAALPAGVPPFQPAMFPPAATALAAAAPSALAGPASPAPGGERDSSGLPWDHRIHAKNKSTKKDGTWRAAVPAPDPAFLAQVTAELRAVAGMPLAQPVTAVAAIAPLPSYAPPVPPAYAAPVQAVQLPGAPVGTFVPPAAALMMPAPPTFQTAMVLDVPQNFDSLMPRITAAVEARVIPEEALQRAVTAHELPNMLALVSRPDYVPVIWNYLKQQYPALQ